MVHKRKVQIEDLSRLERELLGLAEPSSNYVTFSKGHLRVDVGEYIRSDEGRRSVTEVIQHMPSKRRRVPVSSGDKKQA